MVLEVEPFLFALFGNFYFILAFGCNVCLSGPNQILGCVLVLHCPTQALLSPGGVCPCLVSPRRCLIHLHRQHLMCHLVVNHRVLCFFLFIAFLRIPGVPSAAARLSSGFSTAWWADTFLLFNWFLLLNSFPPNIPTSFCHVSLLVELTRFIFAFI